MNMRVCPIATLQLPRGPYSLYETQPVRTISLQPHGIAGSTFKLHTVFNRQLNIE
jgi:hypothetical protein